MVGLSRRKRRINYKKYLIIVAVIALIALTIFTYPAPDFVTETLLYPKP